jgi:hypothetical protein
MALSSHLPAEIQKMEGEGIFRNPRTDKRWTGDMVIRQLMWKRILMHACVRYRYPYQMRHTYAFIARLAAVALKPQVNLTRFTGRMRRTANRARRRVRTV